MTIAEPLFRSLDREVWAITSGAVGRPAGLLATWVMQATLDPQRPLLLAGIAPNHHTAEAIDGCGQLAAHLLRADQPPLGLRLAAASGHDVDKLAGVPVRPASAELPVPVLEECHSWAAGRVCARLDAGDRIFYWVELSEAGHHDDRPPLRQSRLLAAADDATRRLLLADRQRDIELQRPLHRAWRDALPELLRPKS